MSKPEYFEQQLNKIPLTKKFKKQMLDIIDICKKKIYSEEALLYIMSKAYFLVHENKKVREAYYDKLIRREDDKEYIYDDETYLLIVETLKEIIEKIVEIDKQYRDFALTLLFRVYMDGFPITYISLNDDQKWKDIEYPGSQVKYHEDCSSIFKDRTSNDIYQINYFTFSDFSNVIFYNSSKYSVKYIKEDYYYPYCTIIDDEALETLANKYVETILERKYG